MAFAQARAPGWEEAVEAHGVCWAGARVRARPAALNGKACCDKTDVSEPGGGWGAKDELSEHISIRGYV